MLLESVDQFVVRRRLAVNVDRLPEVILLSVILAWAYNGTGSVLIVMVLHAMVNTADILLPLAPELIVVDGVIDEAAVGTVVMVQLAVQLLVVVALVGYYGFDSLARGEIPGVDEIRSK
ncbi:CPBP family intramembrane glutamic endopeptidase [Halobellus ordinarius]|uniref:CPBP family intramembrane glutamic endopeptidase n=1 Tax=Halobellus ordinarius TaxID=3075120 RepID=UPI0031F31A5A